MYLNRFDYAGRYQLVASLGDRWSRSTFFAPSDFDAELTALSQIAILADKDHDPLWVSGRVTLWNDSRLVRAWTDRK